MKVKKPKVCIVGMSASIRGKGCGEIIDSHDEVVRVKHLPDPNMAHDLGRKSSTYAIIGEQIGWHKPLSNYTNQQNINKVLIVDRCSPASNLGVITDREIIDFIEMSDKQTDYFSMQHLFDTYSLILAATEDGTGFRFLTTGLCVILYYLRTHHSVSIAGFASQDETTNYPSWKPELIDGELVYKRTDFTDPHGAHDLCSEIKIINLLVDNKKVRRIYD
tara:strand:+ start:425 stop:1081 length:657 start_codon:yes stop_codon:yes gene_type:complete